METQQLDNKEDVKKTLLDRLEALAEAHKKEVAFAQQIQGLLQEQSNLIMDIEGRYHEVENTLRSLQIPIPQKKQSKPIRQIVQEKIQAKQTQQKQAKE